jgi:hypothetical protein
MSQKIQNQTGGVDPAQPVTSPEQGNIQGEGDYDAARRYRKEVKDFLDKSDVGQLAEEAAPKSAKEARELALAEESGESRSKGDVPSDVRAMYPGQRTDEAQKIDKQ